jgi:DUF4097 and DUF4098 domain-containing protein YvlB
MRTSATLLVLALVAATANAQTERKSLSGQTVAIYNLAGKISIEQGTGSDVTVEVTRGGKDASKLSIAVGELRGANTLRVVYPDDDIVYPKLGYHSNTTERINSDGTWGNDRGSGGRRVRISGDGRGAEAWADLRVLVPAGKHVSVYELVGEQEVNHVNASLRLETGSGSIHTADTKGGLHVEAGSGGIDVRDASGDDISLEAGSGGITANGVTGRMLKLEAGSGSLQGSRLSADELNAEVGSGGIRFDEITTTGRVKLEAGSGSIKATFQKTPKSIDVDAGSGGVTLTLPASLSAEIDVETGSGGIDTDFAVTTNKFERNHLRGKIGGGDSRIHIESGSGTVHLRKG